MRTKVIFHILDVYIPEVVLNEQIILPRIGEQVNIQNLVPFVQDRNNLDGNYFVIDIIHNFHSLTEHIIEIYLSKDLDNSNDFYMFLSNEKEEDED